MRTQAKLQDVLIGFVLSGFLAASGLAQPAPAPGTVKALPVVEEEEPVKPAKPGAPVVEEEQPIKPAKTGAPVVEEEEPVKPAKPGAPVVEEEQPIKPAKAGAPVVEEEQAPAAPADKGGQDDDTLLAAPSIISVPRLDLRMFADVGYVFERTAKVTTDHGFSVGGFDLFATSKLNDKVSVGVEALFERRDSPDSIRIGTAGDKDYRVDIARATLRYRHNKYLNFDMGRFHSGISYYNSTFHNGRWFETAVERPAIATWEYQRGVLPSTAVGLQISGALPSPEALPISYFFEVSNGRGLSQEGYYVQSLDDSDTSKATNIGVIMKPARIPGLELGASLYRDKLQPAEDQRWKENISAFHVVYQRHGWQLISEMAHLRHALLGADGQTRVITPLRQRTFATQSSRTRLAGESSLLAAAASSSRSAVSTVAPRSSISGLYSQLGYRIGKLVPYTRFDYLNAPGSNVVANAAFGEDAGLGYETSNGFFYDLSPFSALKMQVDRIWSNGRPAYMHMKVQLAFAF